MNLKRTILSVLKPFKGVLSGLWESTTPVFRKVLVTIALTGLLAGGLITEGTYYRMLDMNVPSNTEMGIK